MDINIAKGVNYDYILILRLNDEQRLELKKVSIKRSMSLINKLLSYCEDNNNDIVDMCQLFQHSINNTESFEYCLSYSYSDSYIKEVHFPELDIDEYRSEEQAYRDYLYQRAYKRAKYNHRDWSDYELEHEANRIIEDDIKKFIKKKKNLYIKKCLNYIYSFDYNRTLSTLQSFINIISFSNERHGRFAYEHEVNKDLKVRISTNFCYGSASSFRVVITYKGIELLPYSLWVKYYYAGFSELLHCTRSYHVCRSSWDICMRFVVDFVNSAIDNPDAFVRNVVMKEVNEMMNGLRKIFTLGKEYLNRIMELDPSKEREYVGIRDIHHCNAFDRKYYSVYPNEMYLVYRIGKISGALRFLDNLKQLAKICTEINSFIEELFSMNVSIYPELTDAIPPISSDVIQLERKLKREVKQLNRLEKRFEYLDNKLDRILSKCNLKDQYSRQQMFLKANPTYEKLKEQIQLQRNTVSLIQWDLSQRNEFLSDLKRFKIIIEKYVKQPSVA